jgi:hypothetical protein
MNAYVLHVICRRVPLVTVESWYSGQGLRTSGRGVHHVLCLTGGYSRHRQDIRPGTLARVRLAVATLKRYSKAEEYKYRVKTAALSTLKRYSILSLTLYLEWYCAYSILYSGGPH